MKQGMAMYRDVGRQRYQLHMLHASIRVQAEKRQYYSLHSFYQREDQWSEEIKQAWAELNRHLRDVIERSRRLDSSHLDNEINARLVRLSEERSVQVTADSNASPKQLTVMVEELAQAQINQGYPFPVNEQTSIAGGLNTFTISMRDQTYTFSFFVFATDTNLDCLNRMQATINQQRIGIEATVLQQNGQCSLCLTTQPGKESAFSIRDTLGDSVRKTGIDQVQMVARDASYQMDGQRYSAASNQVYHPEWEITLTLLQPATEPVTITVEVNAEGIIHQIGQLVADYNQLVVAIQRYVGTLSAALPHVWNDQTVNEHDWRLLGVTRNSSTGLLSFSPDQLRKSIQDDLSMVKEMVAGPDGLAVRITNAALSWENTPPVYFFGEPQPKPFIPFTQLFLGQAAKRGLFYKDSF